jgi:hypothetical protein
VTRRAASEWEIVRNERRRATSHEVKGGGFMIWVLDCTREYRRG